MILAVAVAFATQAASPIAVELRPIEARLFYNENGRLSDNILGRPEPFLGHNTIIGEGEAEEAANDLLVTVELSALGHHYIEEPVEIVVEDRRGRVLGRRRWDSVLTSEGNGTQTKALWLNDVTCAGVINIRATFRTQVRRATLQLGCGE